MLRLAEQRSSPFSINVLGNTGLQTCFHWNLGRRRSKMPVSPVQTLFERLRLGGRVGTVVLPGLCNGAASYK